MASFANLGGVADPRLGEETDAIGKGRHGSVAAAIAPTEQAHNARRNSLIYVDSSIQFEDYHYWANQSREYEKTLETANVGFAGMAKMVVGRGSHNGEQPIVGVDGSGSDSPSYELSEKKASDTGDSAVAHGTATTPTKEDKYGLTETEWDQAQRASRTATWGQSVQYTNVWRLC